MQNDQYTLEILNMFAVNKINQSSIAFLLNKIKISQILATGVFKFQSVKRLNISSLAIIEEKLQNKQSTLNSIIYLEKPIYKFFQ